MRASSVPPSELPATRGGRISGETPIPSRPRDFAATAPDQATLTVASAHVIVPRRKTDFMIRKITSFDVELAAPTACLRPKGERPRRSDRAASTETQRSRTSDEQAPARWSRAWRRRKARAAPVLSARPRDWPARRGRQTSTGTPIPSRRQGFAGVGSGRRHHQRIHEEKEENDPDDEQRKTRPGRQHVGDLRGRCGKRDEYDGAIGVGECRTVAVKQLLRRERAAPHQRPNQHHREHEREEGRRRPREDGSGVETAEERDRQEREREEDGFTRCGHFRSLSSRAGFQSEASCLRPASSSARNSSAV